MKLERGRPVITPKDYPLTVYNALQGNAQAWRDNRPAYEAETWNRATKLNAYETVGDGFGINGYEGKEQIMLNPDGEALIYVQPDQLEFALVVHGVHKLQEGGPAAAEEVARVDGLLSEIDRLVGRNQT